MVHETWLHGFDFARRTKRCVEPQRRGFPRLRARGEADEENVCPLLGQTRVETPCCKGNLVGTM